MTEDTLEESLSTLKIEPAQGSVQRNKQSRHENPEDVPYEIVPNRIFVGGFPITTSEADLERVFAEFGSVREVNIVKKVAANGVSKGYGFITYESDDVAAEVRQMSDLTLNGRKLNLGPAMRRLYSTLRNNSSSDGTDSPTASIESAQRPRRNYRRPRTYAPSLFDVECEVPAMYVAPFDLQAAMNANSEYQFYQYQVPMQQHTLPATMRHLISTSGLGYNV